MAIGHNRYQLALRAILDEKQVDDGDTFEALLVPEDHNPADSSAVAVFIEGRKCGYLSPADARKHRRMLKRRELAGATTSCKGKIICTSARAGDGTHLLGVHLDLTEET